MFSICKLNHLIKSLKCQRRIFITTISPRAAKSEESSILQENNKKQFDTGENLAVVLYGTNDLKLERREIPKLNTNDVLLAVDCVGLCTDDVQLYVNGALGTMKLQQPIIVGHEASGIVLETGSQVTNLKRGDRVAIEPGQPCRNCQQCRTGRYNLCNGIKFCGTPPNIDGILTHYFKHDANFCFKLPENVSMEEGALLQSVAQGVAICRRTKIGLGSEVLIIGCDTVAIATLLIAQYMGAANLLLVDRHADSLEHAKICGAKTLQLLDSYEAEDMANQIREHMIGSMPDKCIDFIGSNSSIKLAIHVVRPGGICALPQTVLNDHIEIPLRLAINKEVDIFSVNRYCNDYPLALAIMSSGNLNFKPLITHHFKMEESLSAFQLAQEYQKNLYYKIMIHVQPQDNNNQHS